MKTVAPDFVIPVLDLMQAQVVRAVRGERHRYQPIRSCLCPGSDPVEIARALRARSGSSVLYVADLEALQGGAAQIEVLRRLLAAQPAGRVWLDAGFADAAAARALMAALGPLAEAVDPVYASESLRDERALAEAFDPAEALGRRALLSLDRRDGRRLDPAGCWDRPARWPARVIVMTLERVGTARGPDLDTLAEVRRRSPATWLIGAGGVRDADDLRRAAQSGAGAWLVASALHDGRWPAAAEPEDGGR